MSLGVSTYAGIAMGGVNKLFRKLPAAICRGEGGLIRCWLFIVWHLKTIIRSWTLPLHISVSYHTILISHCSHITLHELALQAYEYFARSFYVTLSCTSLLPPPCLPFDLFPLHSQLPLGMEKDNPLKRPFRVIIAGGGMAGLALANALQHSQVDYVMLERRSDIAPQLGASIGLGPTGFRILDQLGAGDKLSQLIEPLAWMGNRRANGDDLAPLHDCFQLIHKR